MSKSKIVITTSDHKKRALYEVLKRHRQTLGEWFDDQLELFVEPQDLIEELQVSAASSATDLVDADQILADLEAVDWAFTDDDTTYLTHDVHPYAAKFIPQIPAHIIARLSLPGELVFDPFSGSSTTAVEALRLGRRAVCIDANPLSELVGRAKTSFLTQPARTELDGLHATVVSLASGITRKNQSVALVERYEEQVPDIPNISHWFSPVAVGELALLRSLIGQLGDTVSRDVALVTFSRIILRASYQDGETRYARRKKEIKPGFALKLFANELQAMCRKLERASAIFQYGQAQFHTLDSRDIPEAVLPKGSVDLLVTSPPYPNANDYHLYHRFRLFWLGSDPRLFGKVEIGSHLKHQREDSGFKSYLSDMQACMQRFTHSLRPGRYAVFVVGDGIYKGQVYRTSEGLASVAKEVGLEVCGDIERTIHQTRRSFVKPARRARSEHILILRKPPSRLQVQIEPPNYRMWGYEETLRAREIRSLTGQSPAFTASSGPMTVEVDCYQLPSLRLLTFSHRVWGEGSAPELTWQAILENGHSANGTRKEPKYASHGIHPYKGKFYPQLVSSLMNISGVPLGSTVLDPFCGSGTTVLEAFLRGMVGVGCDMHPLAVKITSAKVGILAVEPTRCEQAILDALQRLESPPLDLPQDKIQFEAETLDEVSRWFPEPVVHKLNWLLSIIRAVNIATVREFLEVVLSSIIRDVSQQDPRDLRIRRRKPPLEDAPVIELYTERLSEQLQRLQNFWNASSHWPIHPQRPRLTVGDSRLTDTYSQLDVSPGSIDLVVTSPPYATALPYIDTDRLSLLVLLGMASGERRQLEHQLTGSREITGGEKTRLEDLLLASPEDTRLPSSVLALIETIYELNQGTDAGFRRLNKPALLLRYFSDMQEVFLRMAEVLTPSGEMFVVIGDNQTKAGGKTVNIGTTALLKDIGVQTGLACVEEIPITVTTENLRHIKHAITENTILRFRLAEST